MTGSFPIPDWLPTGKQAAVCFSLDDVYPGICPPHANGKADPLSHLRWLLERHHKLRVTLFTTADWRQISPDPTRKVLARVPIVRDRVYLSPRLPRGSMRLSQHPEFVHSLKNLPRVEIGLHGLSHVKRGRGLPVEFAELDTETCRRMLRDSIAILEEAKIDYVRGMTPPGWQLSENLCRAMVDAGLEFAASARDLNTPISRTATTNMSGLKGASLIYPQPIFNHQLLHITTNFQATSPMDRATEIVEHGGLLAIKAHSIKSAAGRIALDGLDDSYRKYLDLLFTHLERTYGDALWWTSMGEISDRVRAAGIRHAEQSA